MRQQHEITTSAPLLGKDGDLLEPGWARSLLPVYRRADIKASPMRVKEWDYYLITDGHIGLALTIADNGYMGLDSISFLHFDEGWEQTTSRMRALPLGKTHLPESSAEGASEIARGGYAMTFYHEDGLRKLSFHMDKFRGKRASSSSPTSRLRAWSSPRPLTSPAISTTTRRSTACAPRAGSSWVTAGSS